MALFGRETVADQQRAERIKAWIAARSPMSLCSVFFGVLSIVDAVTLVIGLLAGVAAVILALKGLLDIRRRPALLGRRLSFTGLALGTLGIMLTLLMATVVYPALENAR